jgi:small membrane protein
MLIKTILIVAALVLFVFFLRQAHTARFQAIKRIGFMVFCLFGIIAVLRPDMMTWIANKVGVGRGTDLLLYILTVVFGFFALNTFLRFRDAERRLTQLARAVALRDAVAPGSAVRGGVPQEPAEGVGVPLAEGERGESERVQAR